jgi:hypothetical protein
MIKSGSTTRLPPHACCLPDRDQLGLVQPPDKPGEWWVTLDCKAVIGFGGDNARARAEQHFCQLLTVAFRRGASGSGPGS